MLTGISQGSRLAPLLFNSARNVYVFDRVCLFACDRRPSDYLITNERICMKRLPEAKEQSIRLWG